MKKIPSESELEELLPDPELEALDPLESDEEEDLQ